MSKLHLRIKAVIFDMDGVITNTMMDHFRTWKIIFQRYGVKVSHYDIYSREGQKGIMSVKEIFKTYHKTVSHRKALQILEDKEELFKTVAKKRFVVGSRSFLRALYKKNIHLGLVTGTSRLELPKILPDYLYDLFSVTVTGTDVKNGKPHPESFLKALKLLKFNPAEAVVIENAPLGIQSAKQAGLRCLALASSLPKQFLYAADGVFSSIKEMRSKISFEKR